MISATTTLTELLRQVLAFTIVRIITASRSTKEKTATWPYLFFIKHQTRDEEAKDNVTQ